MKSELVKRSISSLFLMGLIFVTALINDYIFLSILFIVVIFSWIEWIRVIEKIKPGGYIFTFSCSQVISNELFKHIILSSSIVANRKVTILHQLHQPMDHPVNIFHPESEYLKGLVIKVD